MPSSMASYGPDHHSHGKPAEGRDGHPTANQLMGGFQLTGLGTATNPTDGLGKRAMDKVLTTAGTASAYTARHRLRVHGCHDP